jgi:hypothetical protein
MTDASIPTTVAPQVLLDNHLKTLKLPTVDTGLKLTTLYS